VGVAVESQLAYSQRYIPRDIHLNVIFKWLVDSYGLPRSVQRTLGASYYYSRQLHTLLAMVSALVVLFCIMLIL
jgi:hypothetical protein